MEIRGDGGTESVTGPLTDTELRATPVPVNGTVTANQGTAGAGAWPVSHPAGSLAGATSLPAGTNNIGDVDVLTLPALPTGANTIGKVDQGAAGTADWRTDARRGLTIAFASVDVAASGDNTIVSADPTRKIKMLSYMMVADAAVTARWKSGAGTNLSGAMSFAANGGAAAPPVAPAGGHWLETAINEALVLNLGSATGVRGHVSYVLEA